MCENTGESLQCFFDVIDLSLQLATVEEELRSEGLDPDRDVAETDVIHIPVKSHIAQPSGRTTVWKNRLCQLVVSLSGAQ